MPTSGRSLNFPRRRGRYAATLERLRAPRAQAPPRLLGTLSANALRAVPWRLDWTASIATAPPFGDNGHPRAPPARPRSSGSAIAEPSRSLHMSAARARPPRWTWSRLLEERRRLRRPPATQKCVHPACRNPSRFRSEPKKKFLRSPKNPSELQPLLGPRVSRRVASAVRLCAARRGSVAQTSPLASARPRRVPRGSARRRSRALATPRRASFRAEG